MTDALRFGTIIRLPDGRVGTVVYKGFDGYGIAWGEHPLTEGDANAAAQIDGHRLPPMPQGNRPFPGAQAMLASQHAQLPAVGTRYEILKHQLGPEFA